jgi:hypothetical protein
MGPPGAGPGPPSRPLPAQRGRADPRRAARLPGRGGPRASHPGGTGRDWPRTGGGPGGAAQTVNGRGEAPPLRRKRAGSSPKAPFGRCRARGREDQTTEAAARALRRVSGGLQVMARLGGRSAAKARTRALCPRVPDPPGGRGTGERTRLPLGPDVPQPYGAVLREAAPAPPPPPRAENRCHRGAAANSAERARNAASARRIDGVDRTSTTAGAGGLRLQGGRPVRGDSPRAPRRRPRRGPRG